MSVSGLWRISAGFHSHHSVRGFHCSRVLANTCFVRLTLRVNPNSSEVGLCCAFDLHFPKTYDPKHHVLAGDTTVRCLLELSF